MDPKQEKELYAHLEQEKKTPGIVETIKNYVMGHNGLAGTDNKTFEAASNVDAPVQSFSQGGTVLPSSSFDVDSMGPNADTTFKLAGMVPPPPAPMSAVVPPAPAPVDLPAPPLQAPDDSSDDDYKKTAKNPKVASSHPGFNQDELDKYLLNEKGEMDKFGADKQAADFDALRGRQHSVGNTVGRGLAALGDGLMQGVAQQGNPGYLEHLDQNQARQLSTQTEAEKGFNDAKMAGIKAKEGLDRQSSSNPLGASAAAAMIPMLKQIYPGKTDAEYAQMAHNPAVAEALLPEGVKLADAKARMAEARSNREFQHEMMKDRFDYSKTKDYQTRLEKDTGAMNKDANVVKAQGTLDKLGTARGLLEAGNVNNATAKQALQTALTFVATGGQRVNETEMKQLGGAHTVSNRINQWMQGLDRGTLTPKDYADMKQVISIYESSAHHSLADATTRFANIRAQREHIDPTQARKELGGDQNPVSAGMPQPHPQDDAALLWAQQHPTDPRAIRILKVNGK